MEANELYTTFESESGFKALFDYATIGIVVINSEGQIVMINPNAEKLFGYAPAELIGKKVEVLIPTKLREHHVDHRNQYFESPKIRPMGAGIDLYAMKKDGAEIPVEISLGNYVVNEETLAVAFISDITERKEAEKEKKAYLEELENKVRERTIELENSIKHERELNELKSSFVSLASHEFRTPLSTILSSAALLGKYDAKDYLEKGGKHLARIKSSVRNLVGILNDFLSLDRLEQGAIEACLGEFAVSKLINEVAEDFNGILKRGQEIKIATFEDRLICSDRKLLKNVLVNLISNASKYSAEGDPIEIRCEFQKREMCLSIKDYGIGIPNKDQKKLFGLFYRASNVKTIKGTGLGLNIIKRYTGLFGGKVEFLSKEGHGSTFSVYLPC